MKLIIETNHIRQELLITALERHGYTVLADAVRRAKVVDPTDDGPEVAILRAERQS